jgi:hypothetical protein
MSTNPPQYQTINCPLAIVATTHEPPGFPVLAKLACLPGSMNFPGPGQSTMLLSVAPQVSAKIVLPLKSWTLSVFPMVVGATHSMRLALQGRVWLLMNVTVAALVMIIGLVVAV